jgi:hypothetical protein
MTSQGLSGIIVGALMMGSAATHAQPQTADPARQELPSADIVPDRPASNTPVAPADPSVQSGAGLPACRVWSDGCVACERADGKISCSNIGIACQPGAAMPESRGQMTRIANSSSE